jgi:hypothetical protein
VRVSSPPSDTQIYQRLCVTGGSRPVARTHVLNPRGGESAGSEVPLACLAATRRDSERERTGNTSQHEEPQGSLLRWFKSSPRNERNRRRMKSPGGSFL